MDECAQIQDGSLQGVEDQPFRILLVDDQPIIHEAIRRMLHDYDEFELHCCDKVYRPCAWLQM